VRGSTPTPTPLNARYGGNTPCVQILHTGSDAVILDAGSGIRELGLQLVAQPPANIHLFLTHFHWDHIQGIPFFEPLYDDRFHVIIHAAHPPDEIEEVISAQMQPPCFPVQLERFNHDHRIEFRTIGEAPETIDGLTIQRFPLHHPQGCFGYRVDSGTRRIVYATDHEHGDAAIDTNLRAIAQDADVLIYDAQYTPHELSHHRDWGHSTWLEATCVARDANAKKLVLFHHDPNRTDAALDTIVTEACKTFPQTTAAQEGTTL
jgi:phosphoribosyl 1,2-cyclic phosphodiesterase